MTLAVLLSVCAIPAGAQDKLDPPRDPSPIRVDVDVVNVLCTVRDWKGAFVTDLNKTDFRIREDGKPQEIRYFAREVDTPFTVALLLDVSGSVARILDIERAAASRFFTEVLRPTDQALLLSFAQNVTVWQEITSNLSKLQTALRVIGPFDANLTPEFRPHGGTLLYEAVHLVGGRKLANLPGRKAMVIVTDGVDNGSTVTADLAIKAAQQADAVIYAIHYEDNASSSPEYAAEGESALDRLSAPTGGRTFHVGWTLPLKAIFNTIREEMRSQYAIGYTSTNRVKDGNYRRLEVKTTRFGLKAQARQGYYAPR